jgi:hypothetical protein
VSDGFLLTDFNSDLSDRSKIISQKVLRRYRNDFFSLSLYVNTEEEEEEIFDDEIFVCCSPLYSIDKYQ